MTATRSTSPGNKDDRYVALRALLIKRRNELKLSQREIGERLGLGQQFVSKVEQGERRLDVIEFADFAKAVELDPVALLSEVLSPPR